jgi:hypothetical protein
VHQLAGVEEFTTVTGRECKNVAGHTLSGLFSAVHVKTTHRPVFVICEGLFRYWTLSRRRAMAFRLVVVPRLRDEARLAKTG